MKHKNNSTDQGELFELCKQVYEKTGWEDTFACWERTAGMPEGKPYVAYPELERRYGLWGTQELKSQTPLYTSDYLLEKLLPITYSIQVYRRQTGLIDLMWMPQKPMYDDVVSDTTLKALLKLTLALSEAGEL